MSAFKVKLLDAAEVARRVSATLGVLVTDVRRLTGGKSSLTYAALFRTGVGDERIVIKVAPPGLDPVHNRDVLRQAELLRALQNMPGVAVPAVLATDAGDPPDVPPLFVMTFVEGDSFEPLISAAHASEPLRGEVEERSFAAARMLAALHDVDVDVVASAVRYEPVSGLTAEVERWARALASVDEDIRPATAMACQARLSATTPNAVGPAVLHGDWRLGNMLSKGKEIGAVIDWEIWSIGDPRLDLAWFLAMCDPTRPGAVRTGSTLPPVDHLKLEYERAAGATVTDFDWFQALIRFKNAATSALIVKNNRRQQDPNAMIEEMCDNVFDLVESAMDILG